MTGLSSADSSQLRNIIYNAARRRTMEKVKELKGTLQVSYNSVPSSAAN